VTDVREEKLDFKKILPVFVIVLIDLLGLTVIIPLLPLYGASFGASASMIGILGAAYPVAQFIGAPVLGRLSDRFGRKPVLLFSQVGTLIGFLLLGSAHSLWLLLLSRLVDGLSGANISTAQAVISDNTNEKTRTQGLGLLGAAFGLGFVVGPVIAFVSLAASGNNFHVPAFVAAGFSAVSILLTWFWLDESLPNERRAHSTHQREFKFQGLLNTIRLPLVGFLLALMFMQQIAFGGFEQLLSLFTLNRLGLNASGNAIIFVFVGVIVVAVQGYFIGRWSRRLGEGWLIRLGLFLLSVGLILTALTPQRPLPGYSKQVLEQQLSASRSLPGETPPTQRLQIPLPEDSQQSWLGIAWILVAMIPASVGGGLLQPSINSLLTRSVSPDEVGGTLGISTALLSGANAIAPLAGGFMFQTFGPVSPFLAGGLLLLILWILAMRQMRPVQGVKTAVEPGK
jgi:DHA1 family tetracycline resistance protein-like MFS transporter